MRALVGGEDGQDKSLDCGFFRWIDGGSISKSGDEVSSHSQSYSGMEKIVELESDFGDLVGFVSDLKDFQLVESTWLKLTSQAELQQLKEKIRRLEEAKSKREMKMDYLNRLIALHSAMLEEKAIQVDKGKKEQKANPPQRIN
ncbi:hypothetical protein ACLOJK_036424 [Asimina triloba]